jgi:YD repeat-containing protein
LGTIWRPRFTADPGVFDTLKVDDIPLSQTANGTFTLYLAGFPFNPTEYTLTTKDQLRYRYDQFGGILDITDRNDVVLTFTDTGIFSSVGESIQWLRDAQNRITQIIDPAGNSILYQYNDAGDLTSVADQVGNVTSMSYLADAPHYLDELIDPLGNLLSRTEYDQNGRVDAVFDAFGNSITQTYDLDNNTEIIADRRGNETTFVFDDRGNITQEIDPLGNSTVRVYDGNDNEIQVTNRRGFTTLYSFDTRGNVTTVTDPLGGVITTTYNDRNDVLTITDPLRRVTQNIYDTDGNLIEQIDANGKSSLQTVDAVGRVIARTDRNGHTTQYEFNGGCACPSSPSKIIHPDGAEQQFSYNWTFANLHCNSNLARFC